MEESYRSEVRSSQNEERQMGERGRRKKEETMSYFWAIKGRSQALRKRGEARKITGSGLGKKAGAEETKKEGRAMCSRSMPYALSRKMA